MKKIVGIIAAVAMAASVFAVDFSGALEASGSLFDMTFSDGAKPSALSVGHGGGGMYWGSRIQTAVYADRAGCQFAIGAAGGWDHYNGFSVWVQPMDILKVTFLNAGSKLNQVFDYSGDCDFFCTAGSDWNFELKPADAITVNLVLGSPWLNAGVIGNTGLVFKYGADFGTIGAIFNYSQTAGEKTINNIGFGAGFAGTFDPISMFVDVGMKMSGSDSMALGAEAQVSANIDALGINLYLDYHNQLKGGAKEFKADNDLKVRFKLAYAMDGATPYILVNVADALAESLGIEIKPGVEFSIGAAACNVGALFNITTGDKTTIALSVPFSVSVGF